MSDRIDNIEMPKFSKNKKSSDHMNRREFLRAAVLGTPGAESPLMAGGQSLLPWLTGQGRPKDVTYSELAGFNNQGHYFVMAATEQYRYLYDRENRLACELYDLKTDSDERHNLVAEPAYQGILTDLHRDYVLPFMTRPRAGQSENRAVGQFRKS